MKKVFLWLLFAFCSGQLVAQEGFKIGAHGGIPLGDYNDLVGLVVGADVGYSWAPNKIFDLGIKTGIIHGFPETFRDEVVREKLPSVNFLPAAVSVRVWPGKSFSLGGDVGTAVGLNDGNDGGFYYRPQIGFQVGWGSEINLSYSVIETDTDTWTTATFGFTYTFLSARTLRGRRR